MEGSIDAEQIEHVLSYLARLRHDGGPSDDALEDLRPDWLGMDTWDILLEDVAAQRYAQRTRGAHLRLARG